MSLLTIGYWGWVVACVLTLGQSLLLGLHAWENRRFARRRVNDDRPINHSMRVALLSPCKGMDLDLEQNLRHFLLQNYSNYEVLFIVETEDDSAFPILQRIASQSPVPVRIVVSGRSEHTGQKIHNLIAATKQLSTDVQILAFVDSDICPGPEWLGRMVTRLNRPETLAITGYRWYVPASSSFANCLLYSINASVAALLGPGKQHIVWGGSWAMRREDFEAIGISKAWETTLSDDLVATASLHAAKMPIDYEPACMAASPMDYSFRGLLSFLRRQHLIGRIYAPRLWYRSFATLLVSSGAILGAILLAIWNLVVGSEGVPWPALFFATWYGLQIFRGLIRRDLAQIYVSKWSPVMARSAWFDVFCSPVSLLINTLVMCSACWGQRIVWRGITYDLDQQGRILKLTRDLKPAMPIQSLPQVADRHLRFDQPQSLANLIEATERPSVANSKDSMDQ